MVYLPVVALFSIESYENGKTAWENDLKTVYDIYSC